MSVLLDDVANRRLHHELDATVRSVNHELIGLATGVVTRGAFANVARAVASLRGRYLRSVLALGSEAAAGAADNDAALELRPLREAYTEAMEGFAALEHALQRGYISLAD